MDYGLLAINYGLETRTKLFQAEHFRLKSSCDLQKKLKSKEFVRKENKLDFVTGIAKKHTFLPHCKNKKGFNDCPKNFTIPYLCLSFKMVEILTFVLLQVRERASII